MFDEAVPLAVFFVPAGHLEYAAQVATLVVAVNVPAAQAAQVWFIDVEPTTEMYWPAAQVVCGMQTLLAVALTVVALYVPAAHGVQTRLTLAEATGVGAMYVPRAQVAQGAQTFWLMALVNVPVGQAVQTRFCDCEP